MTNNIKSQIESIQNGSNEIERVISLKSMRVINKKSKRGRPYPALCLDYYDHEFPQDGWKERTVYAKTEEATLIANFDSCDPSDVFHIKTRKNDQGFWVWHEITPVSSRGLHE